MPCTLTPVTLAELSARWGQTGLSAPFPFVTPGWLDAWWRSFGGGDELWLRLVESNGQVIGLAPLRRSGDTARFIGNADVCDYLDFIVLPGREEEFFGSVLDGLADAGIVRLELESLREESVALRYLARLATDRGAEVKVTDTDVTLEMPLPESWEDYLMSLEPHQRHEVRRKGRRLEAAGQMVFDITEPQDVSADLSTLIRLLRISRRDKAAFMTPEMEAYFRRLAGAMASAGWLKFGRVLLDGTVVAAVMCFDYNNTRYLYNSGYEPEYSRLSVGLLSKLYSIRDAIDNGMKVYDYLKGAEIYKYHLGGQEKPVRRAVMELSR
jgi:CelD/BcsL family acetyltransferase involved in cellulose biosynthesis